MLDGDGVRRRRLACVCLLAVVVLLAGCSRAPVTVSPPVTAVTSVGEGYLVQYTLRADAVNGAVQSITVHGYGPDGNEVCSDFGGTLTGGTRDLEMYCSEFPLLVTAAFERYEDHDSALSD